MKRSRAFVLSEQLMTIMLQAGFILVLCTSFYQLISFYTRTQQVLTARSLAERVISFMDDKIRSAGLGLWRCKDASDIRSKLQNIPMLCTDGNKGYRLPIALKWYSELGDLTSDIPLISKNQDSGNVLTLLYAQRDLSSGGEEIISAFRAESIYSAYDLAQEGAKLQLKLLDKDNASKFFNDSLFRNNFNCNTSIKSYAVMEGLGIPIHLKSVNTTDNNVHEGDVDVVVYGVQSEEEAKAITVPAAGELLALNCIQMFVQGTDGSGEGRQFAFRELQAGGTGWNDTYNQEKGILEIYMELDKEHSVLTLWVLASGGYDASMNNPRPETWPKEANPKGNTNTDAAAKTAWLNSTYCHHIVYVSRASWKLNNIPPNFGW